MTMRYACPCCGYLTFKSPPDGTFEICPVCYWEDDGVQKADPNFAGGANGISLNIAKENFRKHGAVRAEFKQATRPPTTEELP